jgi:CDP-3, 6-dideoxy-D-glycero-L-glycero-4-hexulose-4-reductase
MNILITGATGFIGSHLCNRLIENSAFKLYALVRENSQTNLPSHSINKIINSRTLDLEQAMASLGIDGVIHLATNFRSEHTPTEIEELIDSNVTFPTQVIDSAARAKVRWFINTASFWQHYDNIRNNPANLYAATKQAFESILDYYRSDYKISIVSLELADTYGPFDKRKKIIQILQEATKGQAKVLLSPGEQRLNLLHIDDVLDAFEIAINLVNNQESTLEPKYCIYSENSLSLRELACIIEKKNQKTLDISWGGRPYRRREYMNPLKEFPLLPGWKQSISLEQGLDKLLALEPGVAYGK